MPENGRWILVSLATVTEFLFVKDKDTIASQTPDILFISCCGRLV
jgi:hypothetical protein